MSQSHPRIPWIDLAKGVCILLVVFHHVVEGPVQLFAGFMESGGRAARIWLALDTLLSPLRIPLFFAISGFLARRSVQRMHWNQSDRAKIGGLWWLYVVWSILQWGAVHATRRSPAAGRCGQRLSRRLRA